MITPIKTMTISQIIARQDDLLVSADDVKAIAENARVYCETCIHKVTKEDIDAIEETARADEREKVLEEVDKYLRELSNIKSGCGEWIEHHDAELIRRTREQEMNFVERKCKELGIDYTQIYTCNTAN